MDIIATIWKTPYHKDRNQRMMDAGVDVFRVKCSHNDAKTISEALVSARRHIRESGKPVRILADLPEAKIRLGEFPQKQIEVSEGAVLNFKLAAESPGPDQFIPVNISKLGVSLSVDDRFYVGDGQICFKVSEVIGEDSFKAIAENTGTLIFRTSLTIPKFTDSLDHITPFIDEIIAELPKSKPDMISFSFISSGEMLKKLRSKLNPHIGPEWNPMIIAKIESQKGIENIDEILGSADGVMVARGDLALNFPYEKLGVIQKHLVAKAKKSEKYVIVSTQVLPSLLSNYIPARSDINDLTNIVIDGASAVMHCTETAHNEHPERVIAASRKIIEAVEKSKEDYLI